MALGRLKVIATSDARWDFFISYWRSDAAWAEWMAWELEAAGYGVLIQAWDLVPGSNWVQSLSVGVSQSRQTIVILSEGYLASVYIEGEWQQIWAEDPAAARSKLLAVRITESDFPRLLNSVMTVDLFGLSENEARVRLLKMARHALSGRSKPDAAPSFPGMHAAHRPTAFPGSLPRIWNVPARIPDFTGRSEELAYLNASFAGDSLATGSIVSVHGMGGVGKTQLAIEFAHTNAARYDVVWWISLDDGTLLPEQFLRLAIALGLDPTLEPHTLPAAVSRALQSAGPWLLIFDNVEDVNDIKPWLPRRDIGRRSAAHILITTRRASLDAFGPLLHLDVLNEEESVRFLRHRASGISDDIARKIAEEVGHLPLALAQAAAYIDNLKLPPTRYLTLLREYLHNRESTISAMVDIRSTISAMVDISLDALDRVEPAAVQLIAICAYFGSAPLPLDIFTEHPEKLPEPLAGVVRSSSAFRKTVDALVDYSLVQIADADLRFHPLILGAVRARYGEPWYETQPWQQMRWLQTALELLRADAPANVRAAPHHWPRWEQLLPHVLAATGYADTEVAADEQSWLLSHAAEYLWIRGRPAEARALIERALAIDEAVYGPDHPEVAIGLINLAGIWRDLGQLATARPLAERALAIDEAAYGPDHPEVATDLINLAGIWRDLGQLATARPLAERALAIDEAAYGPDHPRLSTRRRLLDDLSTMQAGADESQADDKNGVAVALADLARRVYDDGDVAAALSLMRRAIRAIESTLGPDDPELVIPLNDIAAIMRGAGDEEGAVSNLERALEISTHSLGADHPANALTLANLGNLLASRGRPQEAIRLQRRALSIIERHRGRQDPAVSVFLNNLALTLSNVGKAKEAQSLLRRALKISESAYGAEDEHVVAIRRNLERISEPLGNLPRSQAARSERPGR
jgi:tetratricopeptide (TPR) repeat protein